MRRISFLLCGAFVLTATTAEAADAARGEKLFVDCASCHSLEQNVESVGPSLFGLYKRKAGDVADYRYSPQLKRSAIAWNARTLDDYLADPQKSVPGNRMPYSGMPDAKDRADLLAYMDKFLK